jgi:hypothetical protein
VIKYAQRFLLISKYRHTLNIVRHGIEKIYNRATMAAVEKKGGDCKRQYQHKKELNSFEEVTHPTRLFWHNSDNGKPSPALC